MSFFQRLFGKKNTVEPELKEYSLEELEIYLDNKLKDRFSWLDDYKNQIKETIKEIEKKVINLKTNAFENDADPRVKGRVMDNINNYIIRVNSFSKKVIELNLDNNSILSDLENYKKESYEFSKDTLKNFYIIQMVFQKDLAELTRILKNLDEMFEDISKKLNQKGFKSILELNNNFVNLKALSKKIFDFEKEYNQKNSELETQKNNFVSLQKNREEILKSEDYKNQMDLSRSKDEKNEELLVLKKNIVESFSYIDKALKKLAYDEKSVFLKYYADTPLALIEDNELKIKEYLDILTKKILTKNYDFGDKNQKMLECLSGLDITKLRELRESYVAKLNEIKQIDETLVNSVLLKEIIDLNYKINNTKIKISRLEQDSKSLLDKINKEEYNNKKKSLEIDCFNSFRERIIIQPI